MMVLSYLSADPYMMVLSYDGFVMFGVRSKCEDLGSDQIWNCEELDLGWIAFGEKLEVWYNKT